MECYFNGNLLKILPDALRAQREVMSLIIVDSPKSTPCLRWKVSGKVWSRIRKESIGFIRTCLHGGGGPQVGEVKYGGSPHLSCKRDQIIMRLCGQAGYPPKQVTSPAWGPPPSCKQALMRDYMDKRVTPPKQATSAGVPHLHINRPLECLKYNRVDFCFNSQSNSSFDYRNE